MKQLALLVQIYNVWHNSCNQSAYAMKTAENTTLKIIWKYKKHKNSVTKQEIFGSRANCAGVSMNTALPVAYMFSSAQPLTIFDRSHFF